MITSILLYSIVFLISCFAAWRYERLDSHRVDRQKSRFLKRSVPVLFFQQLLLVPLIIGPPVFIAAFRSLEVGTDTANYLTIYNINKYYNLFEYIKIYGNMQHDYEPGFQQILHIAYILGGGYNLAKAIAELLIITFAWRGAVYYNRRFNVSTALCMFFFYMLEFSYGFNGVRYAIGLSIFYYSFQFVIEKKPIKYALCCFIMFMFHSAFLIAILYYGLNFIGNKTFIKYAKYIMIVLVVMVVLFSRQLINNLSPIIGAFAPRFSYNIDTSQRFGYGIYFIFIIFLLPLIRWNSYMLENEKWYYILTAVLSFIPFRFIGYFSQWLIRLSRMPEILFSVLYSGAKRKHYSKFWQIYAVIVVIGYYVLNIIIERSGEVYPFIFDFTNYL